MPAGLRATPQTKPAGRQVLARGTITLVVVFAVAVIGIAIGGRLYSERERATILEAKSAELSGIRDLKIDEIRSIRENLTADAQLAASEPAARDGVESWLTNRDGAGQAARTVEFLDKLVEIRRLSGARIVSADGTRWIGSTGQPPPTSRDLDEVRDAVRSGEATLTDLHLSADSASPQWDAVAPIRSADGRIIAAVSLRANPAVRLYPLIQSWPTPSQTSETLLGRREGDRMLYLNDLRFETGAALKKSLPETDTALLLSQAANGVSRVSEGFDYRGRPVLGAVAPVPGTAWYIVAKIDTSEALASAAESQRAVFLVGALAVLLIGLGITVAWRQRAVEFYRKSLETERAQTLLAAQYELVSHSVNDAIILVDREGRITQANERAESMYGYTRDELSKMSFDDLADPETPTPVLPIWAIAQPAGSGLLELHQRSKSGERLTTEVSVASMETHGVRGTLVVSRDITEKKRLEAGLREASESLEKLISEANSPIIVWDPQQNITRFNRAFERLTGRSAAEVMEKGLPILFPDETREHSMSIVGQATNGTDFEVVEVPIQSVDGTIHTVLWNNANIYADEAHQVHLAVIAQGQDISERKRAEEQLLRRTDELTQSNAELEKFAYIASHDLQEPLRMIASYTQLLQRRYAGQLDADADEFIGYAVDGAHRLQNLINELLAYSRVGRQGAVFRSVDLERVLDAVFGGLELSLEESGGTVTHDQMPTVWCDSTQIGQVLQNLIGNAIKFHGAAPPRVHVGVRESGDEWVFSVQDNGLGIELEFLDQIFVIFQRLQPRETHQGTGLGLAICKRIIGHHGGRMWVESELGAGSTFFFTLNRNGEVRS